MLVLRSSAQDAPTIDDTVDFIITKLSGLTSSFGSRCPAACDETKKYIWNSTYAFKASKSHSGCSIEVDELTTHQYESDCPFKLEIGGQAGWERITMKRRDVIQVDFSNIVLDSIAVKILKRSFNKECQGTYVDAEYYLAVDFTKETKIDWSQENTGYGDEGTKTDKSNGTDQAKNFYFEVGQREMAEKLAKAFKHAATLCGAKKDLF